MDFWAESWAHAQDLYAAGTVGADPSHNRIEELARLRQIIVDSESALAATRRHRRQQQAAVARRRGE